ncbi:hypothetical protein Leryth_019402 [Lithospermum erythrorhizon]|nr:hypothetical protein Leryth_019402 [Lithospermum erythrorhizon]
MEYKHFSHEHHLTLSKVQEGHHHQCHGCPALCHPPSSIFACWKCNFFLHEHCGNANRFIKHPAHPEHPIILTPTPTYCSGSFICNACGSPGNSFSYSCALCELDLHVNCAFLPLKVTHKAHEHDLYLYIPSPDSSQETTKEVCKICAKELSPKLWSFICAKAECGFRVHTCCTTNEVKPGQYIDDGPEVIDQTSSNSTKSQPEVETNQTQTGFTMDQLNEIEQLRLQMQMSNQLAQMMASFNLANLV